MHSESDLERFVEAQDAVYESVRRELRAGRKATHWMWFVFPQLRGLGRSATAEYYGIGSTAEALACANASPSCSARRKAPRTGSSALPTTSSSAPR